MKTFSLLQIDEIVAKRTASFVEDVTKDFKPGEENSIIDALTDYGDRHEVEMEHLGEMVRTIPSLLAPITLECERLNMIS